MNGRGGVVAFFLFVFLAIIALLQIRSMVKSDEFYQSLNQLEKQLNENLQNSYRRFISQTGPGEYRGDEGDWLVWGFRVEPKTLSPISVENDIYARWITVPYIFEPLLFYDYDEIVLKPFLAESFDVSDDGLQITFHLRDDIYFSDGHPITADDVVFTYNTIVNPEVDASDLASLYSEVERAEKIDDLTVRFVFKRPHFQSLDLASLQDVGVLPEHIYKFDDAAEFNKMISNPVGSGPFVFDRWNSGKQVVIRRNENYWGRKPKLEKIVYRFITNSAAAIQALRSHQVDIIIPEPDQFAELAEDKQFNENFRCLSYWTPMTPFYYIGWNMDSKWFSDRNVRLAMTHIVDRNRIVERLLKGYGKVVTGPFYIYGKQYDSSVEPWSYDLQKAKELLIKAGWVDSDGDGIRDKNGVKFSFDFLYSADKTQYQRLVKFIKDEAAKVGIEVIPEPMEWSVVISRITDRDFDAMVMGWGGSIESDPYQLWHSSQIGNRGANYVGFNNPQADTLIEQIRTTLDVDKRNGFCHRLHRILHNEQPYTFLFTRPTFRPVDKRFENVKIYNLGPKYWQWYVPKERQRY